MTQSAMKETLPFDIHSKRNIHALSEDELSALMRREFELERGTFQQCFGDGAEQVNIACANHCEALREELYRHLVAQKIIAGHEPFEALHDTLSDEMRAYTFNDGVNAISKQCYEMPDAFRDAYISFVRDVLYKEVFKRPFWFQQTPTLRIHCPNAENSHHYPRYHTDVGYGHPPGEINIWVPLTEAKGEQHHGFRLSDLATTRAYLDGFDYYFAPFIDKAIDDDDFTLALNERSVQVKTPYGEALLFDSRILHTGEPLVAHTRASMDIRIILCDVFDANPIIYQGAGRRKVLFTPGHCYDPLSSDLL